MYSTFKEKNFKIKTKTEKTNKQTIHGGQINVSDNRDYFDLF